MRKEWIKQYKNADFEENEAIAEIDFAIEAITSFSRMDLLKDAQISDFDRQKIQKIIYERLKTRRPLAQLLRCAFFAGKKFKVSEDTLIPRPETELLVEKSVELIKKYDYKQVLDIGTGTGCIACMVALKTDAQVLGIDISTGALRCALDNAMGMGLMNRALFRKSDIFSNIQEKFDLIISNPPYIPLSEKENLQIEVRDYDPACALFTSDEKGIEFYEKIAKKAKNHLNPAGALAFELGIGQYEDVSRILCENGFSNIEIYKDLGGIERVITAQNE